jgi:hydrogenase maturation factor HypF (carbamoyltransferase family)|tara:strand:+ start:1797 stop:1931 length:135 start_codon:yes stop_codon:yes gene_type:complete
MKLRCQKCKREWDYSGDKKYYTSCPDCKTSVKINEKKKQEDVFE